MRRLICWWRGHRWRAPHVYAPTFRICDRCAAIGYWVPD